MLITVIVVTLAAYPVAFGAWIMGASFTLSAVAFYVVALAPLVLFGSRLVRRPGN
jgi:hypothetical protein